MTDAIILSHLEARNPHRAVAAHVAEFGDDTAKALYLEAIKLNALYFGGKLGDILIEIAAPASPAALATHQPRTPEGLACVIRIAPSVVACGPNLANDALLHEMIHVWQTETDNREPGYQGHGPKFAGKCNEIGAVLGLEPVVHRARDGQKDCAQWPLNVRPEGYYGEGKRAVKAVTRARKAKGTRRAGATVATQQSALDAALEACVALNSTERALVCAALAASNAEIR